MTQRERQTKKGTRFHRTVTSLGVSALLALVTFGAAQRQIPPESWLIPEGTFPLTEEPATLRVFAPALTDVDLNTNGFTKWYEEQTGVTVEWLLAPSGQDANQALNLLIASGDYPDIIMFELTPSQQMLYGQQGILIPLNDLIEEHGTMTRQVFETFPTIQDAVTAPDGTVYGLPEANECCHSSQSIYIYKPWLDKLGLEMPTTTEAFYEVLKAFKEQDPNGNGKADEIALTGAANIWNYQLDSFLMNAFTLNPLETNRLSIESGKVVASYTKPEYREGLRYLHKLYAEGLIAPEAFTQSEAQLLSQGMSETPIVGAVNAGTPGYIADWGSQRNKEYYNLPPLRGPEGQRVTPYVPVYGSARTFITSAAQDPELAFRWMDALYLPEVGVHAYYGTEDVTWRWADPGEMGTAGTPAVVHPLESDDANAGGWNQLNHGFRPAWFRNAEYIAPDSPWVRPGDNLAEIAKYAQPVETLMPQLFFTAEQSQELADIEATVSRYVEEMLARFVTGDATIGDDAAWEEFQSSLNAMGLSRMLEIYQSAYDAKTSD